MRNAPGELWELATFYQYLWKVKASSYILLKRFGNTDVWISLCVETLEVVNIVPSSSIYQRVI